MRLSVVWAVAFLILQVASQVCNSAIPCERGCCNTHGYCGFGPDYCGEQCISDCDRKSECNPGYGSEWAQKDKCPLNVCCSDYGYCGTSEAHCGKKLVQHPVCSNITGNDRIVGYYEGWAANRGCNAFRPEQIPVPLYTHINFAYAAINPESFIVLPGSRSDIGLYQRLVLLKNIDPQLKVYISLGGHAFDDTDSTSQTFLQLIVSVDKQKTFIESLISFLSTYGFDGVDLNWQFPSDPSKEEYAGLPQLVSRISQSLTAIDKGITVTTPASFRHLKHFDIKALSTAVDWFNVRTYDLHGSWDQSDFYTDTSLNAHNNLTAIDQALGLFWRNGIAADQVVMGLGFYGRSLTAASSSCLEPGCEFESPGEPGSCSRHTGVLLNSEIDGLVKKHNVTPKLDKGAAVKIAAWDNQWVAYEDEETLKIKSAYAQSRCLGGLMVLAISHDTADAKYSKFLAKVANNRPTVDEDGLETRQSVQDPAYEFEDIPKRQCKWTNCGQGCPRGWKHVKRSDDGARSDEYMIDESGCNGKGVSGSHAFCCPPTQQPTCGWYGHNNGQCDISPSCPDGMGIVGGNSKYCRNIGYQAACCTTDVESIELYTTCAVGGIYCDRQNGCPFSGSPSRDTLIAESGSGMGGAVCRRTDRTRGGRGPICCDTSDRKKTFAQCEWTSGCDSSCPGDKVRIALDTEHPDCFPRGGKARCCKASFYDTIHIENPKLDEFHDELVRFLENPVCWNSSVGSTWAPNPTEPFSGEGATFGDSSTSLSRRWLYLPAVTNALQRSAASPGQITTHEMCVDLMVLVGHRSMLEAMENLWNEYIAEKWRSLRASNIREVAKNTPEFKHHGPFQLCQDILCSPFSWNNRIGNAGARTNCSDGFCALNDPEDAEACNDDFDNENDNSDSNTIRRSGDSGFSTLSKRTTRSYQVNLRAPNGQQYGFYITLPGHYTLRDLENLYPNDPLLDEVLNYESYDDCGNLRLEDGQAQTNRRYNMEHPFDGNLVARFLEDAAAGMLRSGATAQTGAVSLSFFRQARTMPLPNPPPLPFVDGELAANPPRIMDRVMGCLGSYSNRASFVPVFLDINAVKTPLMQGNNPVAQDRWEGLAQDPNRANYVLMKLKATISVMTYLNRVADPNPNERLTTIINNVGEQLQYAQQVYNTEWTHDFFDVFLVRRTRTFVTGLIREMRKYWAVQTGNTANEVLETLRIMEQAVENQGFGVDTSNFDGNPPVATSSASAAATATAA